MYLVVKTILSCTNILGPTVDALTSAGSQTCPGYQFSFCLRRNFSLKSVFGEVSESTNTTDAKSCVDECHDNSKCFVAAYELDVRMFSIV